MCLTHCIACTLKSQSINQSSNHVCFSRLELLTDDDFHKAEEFLCIMKLLYTLTGCVSSEQSPLCGQILPILNKLQVHFAVAEEDTPFTRAVKEKVWADLAKRYQVRACARNKEKYIHTKLLGYVYMTS